MIWRLFHLVALLAESLGIALAAVFIVVGAITVLSDMRAYRIRHRRGGPA